MINRILQRGRIGEAEVEFERLLGGPHVKSALAELSRSDKGDDAESVKYSELLYGRHFRGKHSNQHSFSASWFSCMLPCCHSFKSFTWKFCSLQVPFLFLQLFLLELRCLLYNSYQA